MRSIAHTPHSRLRQAVLLITILGLSACGGSNAPDVASLDQKGEWTFVNYWANWCKPCIKEIPELNKLHTMQGVRVLGVNYDGAVGDDLQAQLTSLNVQFPTLTQDPATRYDVDRPQVLPTTLVISPEGKLLAVLVGPQTEKSLLEVAGLSRAPTESTSSDSGNE